jgi:hypothetical protein
MEPDLANAYVGISKSVVPQMLRPCYYTHPDGTLRGWGNRLHMTTAIMLSWTMSPEAPCKQWCTTPVSFEITSEVYIPLSHTRLCWWV